MTSTTLDPLVQEIERVIDGACESNRLMTCNRDLALWSYLAFCEDMLLKEVMQQPDGPRRSAMFSDRLVNTMKYPIRWIWQHCRQKGHLSREHNKRRYSAAWDLSKLADEYEPFETVYIFARAGHLNLSAAGDELTHSGWHVNAQYEAYDHLSGDVPPSEKMDAQALYDCIEPTIRVSGDRFKYAVTPGLVDFARETMLPIAELANGLPRSWQFPDFDLGQFCDVTTAIRCLAMIHHMARSAAASKGCIGLGIRDAVLVLSQDALESRIVRYTGLNCSVVSKVLGVLIYGSSGLRSPDPALQPLLPLSDGRLAIAPSLWINLNLERNFCVLANRIPAARDAYSRLSEDRSKLLESELRTKLGHCDLDFWSGEIPGRNELPDIDLALIDRTEKTCLVLELKSFIQPAEPRELVDRSEEIEKGSSQALKLRAFAEESSGGFLNLLGLDPGYRLCFAVASKNSIGSANVQDPATPVVRASHLANRIRGKGLTSTCDWLESRCYLPSEGVHFETIETNHQVAEKTVSWYGIKPLVERLD